MCIDCLWVSLATRRELVLEQPTFMIESANFMTQDTRSPLNAKLATTMKVMGL